MAVWNGLKVSFEYLLNIRIALYLLLSCTIYPWKYTPHKRAINSNV